MGVVAVGVRARGRGHIPSLDVGWGGMSTVMMEEGTGVAAGPGDDDGAGVGAWERDTGVDGGGEGPEVAGPPPKRPTTAYFMFTASRRGDDAFKGMGVAEAAKAMAAEWRALDEATRGEFEKRARDAKAMYAEELEAWKARGGGTGAGDCGEGEGAGGKADGGPPGSVLLPLARVKKMCKADPEVKNLSGDAVNLTAKATELFIAYIAEHAALAALKAKRRTVRAADLATAIRKQDHLGLFLEDIADEIEAAAPTTLAGLGFSATGGRHKGARVSPRSDAPGGGRVSGGTVGGGKRVRASKEQLARESREAIPGAARITAFFQKGAKQFGTGEEGETQDDGGNAPLRRAGVGSKRGAFVLDDDDDDGEGAGLDLVDSEEDAAEESDDGEFVAEKENVAPQVGARSRAGRQAASRAARAERRMQVRGPGLRDKGVGGGRSEAAVLSGDDSDLDAPAHVLLDSEDDDNEDEEAQEEEVGTDEEAVEAGSPGDDGEGDASSSPPMSPR